MFLAWAATPLNGQRTISADTLYDKIRGMWLGQLIGNAAGRPAEGNYTTSPNPNSSVPWVIKEIWDGDDDTDIEYIALHILETNGFDCTEPEIADQWQNHSTGWGLYIANRQAWYLMGDGYVPPLTGSRQYNEHWYAIDSQITTEVLGAVCPGMVQQAIDLAGTFARISNEGFPIHAAQLYAAMYAEAFFADPDDPNMVNLVAEALNAIPVSSRTHKVVSDVLNWYLEDIQDDEWNWRSIRQKIYDKYMGPNAYGRYYNWIESTVNSGATVLALLYGGGDFKKTVQIGILAGWDCDCNPATAGGLIGIIKGFCGLPTDLTDDSICGNVYQNVYRPYLPDPVLYRPQYEDITNIARRIAILAGENILAHGGYQTFEPNTYHIPDPNEIVPEPEKYDPNGTAGLVHESLAAGISVIPTAAIQRDNSDLDRENIYNIINGITDNSYNGHKSYWSYHPDPEQRPEKDWYQLNFSQPVKFAKLTFYEGDITWEGINTYYRNDTARGGYFENVTVEILRNGHFISPANLEWSEPLDRFKMYQNITFDFAPTVGDAIRIIGSPGGSMKFTTIMELEVFGDVDTGLYVTAVDIAEGQQQRSWVAGLAVEFNCGVLIDPNDMVLSGTTCDTSIDANDIDFAYDEITHQLCLKFDMNDDGLYNDSLPNDTYELRLNCASITDIQGTTLLDDDDTPHDGFYTIKFHRLFGDADGSRTVDMADLLILVTVWLEAADHVGLEANGDAKVNMLELVHFAKNWLRNYP